MRTLRFIVKGQTIERDPECDFDGLVPGSERYVQAKFILSPEWRGAAVVVSFWSVLGKEYDPQVLRVDNTCDIPVEALQRRTFKIGLVGKTSEGWKLRTNRVAVSQNGGI